MVYIAKWECCGDRRRAEFRTLQEARTFEKEHEAIIDGDTFTIEKFVGVSENVWR